MRRNAIAKDLRTPKYAKRIVKSAKRYSRRAKHPGRAHEA